MWELVMLPMALFAWFALFRWVLPAVGIPTCLSGVCGTAASYPSTIELILRAAIDKTFAVERLFWVAPASSRWRIIKPISTGWKPVPLRSLTTGRAEYNTLDESDRVAGLENQTGRFEMTERVTPSSGVQHLEGLEQ